MFHFTYFSIFTLLRMTPPTTMGSSAPSSERVATDPLQKGRLQNSNFVKSAPEEVILETRENLKLKEEEERTLSVAALQL